MTLCIVMLVLKSLGNDNLVRLEVRGLGKALMNPASKNKLIFAA